MSCLAPECIAIYFKKYYKEFWYTYHLNTIVAWFWLDGLAPKCRLIAFIDAASGEVCWARFSLTESTQSYFEVLLRHVQTRGLPLALFSDRHSIFNKHDPKDPIPSQFERALLQLCIGPIQAYSPPTQGKCRVAVSDALQDLLIKAMRLLGISSMQQANNWLDSYLHTHIQRFAVRPREAQDAHLPYLGTNEALQRICALRHQRQLSTQLSC